MARRQPPRSDVAGFTLVETLIAVALMAAILTALATVTAQWLPNWNRGFARVQRAEALALGLDRLVADLAAAQFVSAGREFAQPVFEGTALSVTLVRPAFGPNASPGLEVIRIAETTDGRGRAMVRRRAPFVPVVSGVNDRTPPDFTDPVVLIRDPYRASFSYAAADQVWKDTWSAADQLPRMVRITLRDAATGRVLSLSTAATIRAELPAQCVTAQNAAGCPARSAAPTPGGAGDPRSAGDPRAPAR
jgi:general secretion pathway protein J